MTDFQERDAQRLLSLAQEYISLPDEAVSRGNQILEEIGNYPTRENVIGEKIAKMMGIDLYMEQNQFATIILGGVVRAFDQLYPDPESFDRPTHLLNLANRVRDGLRGRPQDGYPGVGMAAGYIAGIQNLIAIFT